ncbi:MAG: hypothetical protein M1827_005839 [Pycnora praestabilis]|nr:MAG: hypothetical protein M1827_005839 [Pycnora praestabilis]
MEQHHTGGHKNIPILPSSTVSSETLHGDPMEVTTPPSATMGPPMNSSPDIDHAGPSHIGGSGSGDSGHMNNAGTGPMLGTSAAAATQQPKVVQTAFIHKLYNMLEDPNIQHLISWSSSAESFVMSPSTEFSKVLAQYFKHTNISSFVRQLNMYGFQKVSDVFHTGSPESTLWEFKHGNGNFKRGDLVGLREIKRRASRHALIHRDSFSAGHKASISQPGTPAETVSDSADARLSNLEHNLYDVYARLARTEESYSMINSKCQALIEGLIKSHLWSYDLANTVMGLLPGPDHPIHREACLLQKDISRQMEMLRTVEEPHESLLSGRQSYFANISLDAAPVSPRQVAQDDQRRSSILSGPRQNFHKPPVPSHMAVSPRRYGSIGGAGPALSTLRPQVPPQPPPPPPPHPLASAASPPPTGNLARRHTSADIRLQGWPGAGGSPFASGQNSTHWPSSPNAPANHGDQQVRDVLAQYELPGPRPSYGSRHATPPLPSDVASSSLLGAENGWSFGGSKLPPKPADTSYPPTRRSSMAMLLNPAETTETSNEDDATSEDRKRKRLQ